MLACMQKQYVPEFPVFSALQKFPVFPALKLPSCKQAALLNTKHSEKKIVLLFWAVAAYLPTNFEHGIELDINSAY